MQVRQKGWKAEAGSQATQKNTNFNNWALDSVLRWSPRLLLVHKCCDHIYTLEENTNLPLTLGLH